jgi:hypothetical protein
VRHGTLIANGKAHGTRTAWSEDGSSGGRSINEQATSKPAIAAKRLQAALENTCSQFYSDWRASKPGTSGLALPTPRFVSGPCP